MDRSGHLATRRRHWRPRPDRRRRRSVFRQLPPARGGTGHRAGHHEGRPPASCVPSVPRRRASSTTPSPARSRSRCGIRTGCCCSTRPPSRCVAASRCPARPGTCSCRRRATRCSCRPRARTRWSRSRSPVARCGRPRCAGSRTTRPGSAPATSRWATSSAVPSRSCGTDGCARRSPASPNRAGVTALGDTLAVVDVGAFTVSTYDARTLHRTGRVAAGAGPTHLVALGDRLVVTDTRGGAVLVFATNPLREVSRLPLRRRPVRDCGRSVGRHGVGHSHRTQPAGRATAASGPAHGPEPTSNRKTTEHRGRGHCGQVCVGHRDHTWGCGTARAVIRCPVCRSSDGPRAMVGPRTV